LRIASIVNDCKPVYHQLVPGGRVQREIEKISVSGNRPHVQDIALVLRRKWLRSHWALLMFVAEGEQT
jgi:hypothetical protein